MARNPARIAFFRDMDWEGHVSALLKCGADHKLTDKVPHNAQDKKIIYLPWKFKEVRFHV